MSGGYIPALCTKESVTPTGRTVLKIELEVTENVKQSWVLGTSNGIVYSVT